MIKIKGNPSKISEDITEFLEKQEENQELICYIGKKENKEAKTRFQEQFYYGLFGEISKFLGENLQDVKMYFLAGAFGIKKLRLSKTELEIPIISRTRDLQKEQAILLIDLLLKFIKKHNITCKYTPRELESLYLSYN